VTGRYLGSHPGFGRPCGTMPIQIAGNVHYGGLYETACGLMLGEIVYGLDGGTPSGQSHAVDHKIFAKR
jgi:NADH:ubiquinone oxidoreductase subunit F (NADH-binding)